ncbi:MAG: transposase [Coriobacteriia bacterium]|nr:transposase [Coriobacteriia bacterium]
MDRSFPFGHWVRACTDNDLERLNRETKQRVKAGGVFPDGEPASMSVAARCRHVAESNWGQSWYLDISRLEEAESEEELGLQAVS